MKLLLPISFFITFFIPKLLSQQSEAEPLKVFAGNDTTFCYSMNHTTHYIGTNLLIENGQPPYRYAWECKVVYGGYLEFGASSFLNDTTSATPWFKAPFENNSWHKLILHVWDDHGNHAKDSMNVRFSSYLYSLGYQVHYLEKGDSLLFTPGSINVAGGIPPLTYRWTPVTGLTDTLSITTWCKPEFTTYYGVVATDSIGCASAPSMAHQVFVFTVGEEPVNNLSTFDLNLRQNGNRIHFNNPEGRPARIRLFDLSGRIIADTITREGELSLEKYIIDHGVFIIVVQVEDKFNSLKLYYL